MRLSTPVSKLFSILTALTLFFSIPNTAHAALGDFCWQRVLGLPGTAYCSYVQIRESFANIDIRRTIVDAATAMAIDVPSQLAFGRNFDQLQVCMTKIIPGMDDIQIPTELQTPNDDCSDLSTASVITGKFGFPTQRRSTGSLMGLGIILEDITTNEPLPINLAYYGKRMASKIPVLNQTAYAANGDDPFSLQVVAGVWEKIRNISYGALALFMLAIGVMVMLRQKINPQTVITVQAAIPRIIIAVVLITFSYPIAALALQLILPLSGMALGLLDFAGTISNYYSNFPITTAITMSVIITLMNFLSGGVFMLLIGIIMIVTLIFLVIKVFFKILMSYVKIVYGVLIAPLTFAWGAIPGNELATVNWFKTLLVNILAVPCMFFGIGLAFYVSIRMTEFIVNNPTAAPGGLLGDVGSYITGASLIGFYVPLIVVVILLQTGKIPEKLEEAILGREPKKKGGK